MENNEGKMNYMMASEVIKRIQKIIDLYGDCQMPEAEDIQFTYWPESEKKYIMLSDE